MRTIRSSEIPYIGLQAFSEKDAVYFFGREKEQDVIIANLLSSRLTIMYGESGVGKSSLVNAGVIYQLKRLLREKLNDKGYPKFAIAAFSEWSDDPVKELTAGVRAAFTYALRGHDIELSEPQGSLAETFKLWTEQAEVALLLILDQFEEYFVNYKGDKSKAAFLSEFQEIIATPNLRINILLSIREDAYAKLECFSDEISDLLGYSIEIKHMSREAARRAIEQPLKQYNCFYSGGREYIEIEPALVNRILEEVRVNNLTWGDRGRGGLEDVKSPQKTEIEAPFLQIVMERLWKEDVESGSAVLRLQTLDNLAKNNLKGTEVIIRDHLLSAINKLTDEQKSMAYHTFDRLVTPSGFKIPYTAYDLAKAENLDKEQLEIMLDLLNDNRILRVIKSSIPEAESRCEIFHDVLAPAILEWRRKYSELKREEENNQARAKLEQQVKEQRDRAEKERKYARRMRALAIVIFLFFLFACVSALVVWQLMKRVEAEKARVEEAKAHIEEIKSRTSEAIVFDQSVRDALHSTCDEASLITTRDIIKKDLENFSRESAEFKPVIYGFSTALLAAMTRKMGEIAQDENKPERAASLYKEAENYAKDSVKTLEDYLGKDNPYVATVLNELGGILQAQTRLVEAEQAITRAVNITDEVWKSSGSQPLTDISIAHTANLAEIFMVIGRYEKAKQLCLQVLEQRKKSPNSKAIDKVKAAKKLANVHLLLKEYDEAALRYEEALKTVEGHEDKSSLPEILLGLANSYNKKGQLKEAESRLLQAREIIDRYTDDSINTAFDKGDLGERYFDMGHYAEAERYLKEALRILGNPTGMDSLQKAKFQFYFASVFLKQKRYSEAEPLFKAAIETQELKLGSDHPLLADTLEGYASLLRETGRDVEAAEKESRVNLIRSNPNRQ